MPLVVVPLTIRVEIRVELGFALHIQAMNPEAVSSHLDSFIRVLIPELIPFVNEESKWVDHSQDGVPSR